MNGKQKEGVFQNNLRKSAAKKIILLLLFGAFLFMAGLLATSFIENELNASRNLNRLERVFVELYENNASFLQDERTGESGCRLFSAFEKVQTKKELLADRTEEQAAFDEVLSEFKNLFRRFDDSCSVKNDIIVTDRDGLVLFSSFNENKLSSYLLNYNNAVCYNARNCREDEIYNAVYYDRGDFADYIFVKPVYDGAVPKGYISLYLSGSGWNFYLDDSSFDGVITDLRQNVMYCSKACLADSSNKFYGVRHGIWQSENGRYWIRSKELPLYSAVIYSMVYSPKSEAVYVGLISLLVIGFLWYGMANWMAKTMAENNAASIETLVNEIRIIRKGDYEHRIQMDTEDEFSEVAYQVNHMLDSINALNSRNTELLKLNNLIEMNQLTAQMNPHFLYNTLEIIRNLVTMDADKAEELIVRLTEVLRYSVDNSRKDVPLGEDMKYIGNYLEIQNCRFGSRFSCDIDIDECCLSCMIPKLLLQPIIENSIKYGFQKQMELHLWIQGRVKDKILYLSVRDDGPGMEQKLACQITERLGKQFNDSPSNGLYNIARRLYLQYGASSGLELRNEEGKGLNVLIRIRQNGTF